MSKKSQQRLEEKLRAVADAQFAHPGVKGVTMFCGVCCREYNHVHPTQPAYCNDGHKPVQVREAKHIVVVHDVVARFFMRNKLH